MTDQLTALRRKYGTIREIHPTLYLEKNPYEKDLYYKNLYVAEYYNSIFEKPYKCYVLASTIKKAKNIVKHKFYRWYELNFTVKVTKYNEQAKLTTKTKVNTITNIINRVKADWEHIRS